MRIRHIALLALVLATVVVPFRGGAQEHPLFGAGAVVSPGPSHEAHMFAEGRPLAFPADPRLDLPDGEGVVEFWFRRGWDHDLAKKSEYVCVIADGRAMVDPDDPEGLLYRTRYAVYLNEEVVAVQVGSQLKATPLFGAGTSGREIVGSTDQDFVHVALIFRDGAIQPVIAGRPLPLMTDMPLGDVFGSEVTVGSIGSGQGDFPSDGSRMKPVETEVHDFEGELARVRVWSQAFSDRYFTAEGAAPAVMDGLEDESLRRGIAFQSLGIDYTAPGMSDLVGRSDFRGDPAKHRMVLVSPLHGMWVAESFPAPVPAPPPAGLDAPMGDIAAPALVMVVPSTRPDLSLVYLDGRHVGVLRDQGGGAYAFEPAGGKAAELSAATGRLYEDGKDVLELDFDSTWGLAAFADPHSSPRRTVRLVRPDPVSWRGEPIDASNAYISHMLHTFTKVAARGYDIVTMDPVNLTPDSTGTPSMVFAEPRFEDWKWDLHGTGAAAPRWFHIVASEQGGGLSLHTVTTTSDELRAVLGTRLGSTTGLPGKGGVAFDVSHTYSQFRTAGQTRATTVSMMYATMESLVLDKAQAPLSEDFVRAVWKLRGAGGAPIEHVLEASADGVAVESDDHTDPSWKPYRDFIEQWGTHYAYGVTYGQILMTVTTLTEDEMKEATKQGFDVGFESRASGSLEGGGTESWGPRGGASAEVEKTWSELFHYEEKQLLSYPPAGPAADPTFAQISTENSVPIFLDLRPLSDLLSPAYFDDPIVYTDVRERLRQEILAYMKQNGGQTEKIAKRDAEQWSQGPLPDRRPRGAIIHLRPVSLRAENVREPDGAGEFVGTLTVTPWVQGVVSAERCGTEGTDADGRPKAKACAAVYKGPDPENPSVPNPVWWQARNGHGEMIEDDTEVEWSGLANTTDRGERTYEITYPQYDEEGKPVAGLDVVSLDDLVFFFDWAAYEDDPDIAKDDQLYGHSYGNDHTDGHLGTNWKWTDDKDHDGVDHFARWAIKATELRDAGDDYKLSDPNDPWFSHPPKATSNTPRTLRLVLRHPDQGADAFSTGFGALINPGDALSELKAQFDDTGSSDLGLILTVEAWVEEPPTVPTSLGETEQQIAKYSRTVREASPRPALVPTERVRYSLPGLVGFYPLDHDGADASGQADDLPNPIPPERRFDGGLLYGDPYLGTEGTFTELPFYEPTFVVPAITDGSFTVRMSFRARSPKATGLGAAELPSLPLLVRGDGDFVLTNAALTLPGSASYSEALAGGVDRSNVMAFEGWPRSPVWATVTAAVDLERKQIRYRFDVTLPTYLDLLPAQQRASTLISRMASNFDPGTATDWHLSMASPDGRLLYGADAVDEVMFFDHALSFEEMAALPQRSKPGSDDRAAEAAIHVANMYTHAARLPELQTGFSQADWDAAVAGGIRDLFAPRKGWSYEGNFIPDYNEDGVLDQREFDDLGQDARRALALAAGAKPDVPQNTYDDNGKVEPYTFKPATWEGPARTQIQSVLGRPTVQFTMAVQGVPDTNGNNQIDRDEFEQFPEGARTWLLSRVGFTPEGQKPFLQMADMTFQHDLQMAVLTADLDDDQRLSDREAKVLLDALGAEYHRLGLQGTPDLPDLVGAPITTFWKPANESAQKRISDWLLARLAERGVDPDGIPMGIRHL